MMALRLPHFTVAGERMTRAFSTLPPQFRNMSRLDLLHLYRRLLRACQTYPSKNRAKLYEAIRLVWRDHKETTNENDLLECFYQAHKGLEQLQLYDELKMTKGRKGHPVWEVTLEQNPVLPPNAYQRKKK
jgi:hypothetical protein